MSLKNNLSILQIVNLKIIDFQYFSVLFFYSFSAQSSSFQVIPPPTTGKYLLFYRNVNNNTIKSNSDKVWEATVDFPVLQTDLNLVSHCIPQNNFWDKSNIYYDTFLVLLCANILTSKVCWLPFRRTFVFIKKTFSENGPSLNRRNPEI